MRIEFSAHKDILGRKTGQIQASFGEWKEMAKDKATAEANLIQRINNQSLNNQMRHYWRGRNFTLALSYADGWQYDIVSDEQPNRYSSCMLSVKNYNEALNYCETIFKQLNS